MLQKQMTPAGSAITTALLSKLHLALLPRLIPLRAIRWSRPRGYTCNSSIERQRPRSADNQGKQTGRMEQVRLDRA